MIGACISTSAILEFSSLVHIYVHDRPIYLHFRNLANGCIFFFFYYLLFSQINLRLMICSIFRLQAVLDVGIEILAAIGEDDGVTRWLD